MVLVVGKITALLAHQLLVHHAVGHEILKMVSALGLLLLLGCWSGRIHVLLLINRYNLGLRFTLLLAQRLG